MILLVYVFVYHFDIIFANQPMETVGTMVDVT
jgi:hypothetical protein